jgi:hypothetical protein
MLSTLKRAASDGGTTRVIQKHLHPRWCNLRRQFLPELFSLASQLERKHPA